MRSLVQKKNFKGKISSQKRRTISPLSKKEKKAIEYVLPVGNGWVVKNSLSKIFTAITDTKSEAILIAKNCAKTKKSAVVIYHKNGTISKQENFT